MKRILIVAGGCFVILIGAIVFFCSYNFDKINFGKELLMYSDAGNQENKVFIIYNGDTTEITGYNRTSLYQTLLRGQSTRKRCYIAKKESLQELELLFGDEVSVIVKRLSEEHDEVFIIYRNLIKKRTKYYTVDSVKTWDNLVMVLDRQLEQQ